MAHGPGNIFDAKPAKRKPVTPPGNALLELEKRAEKLQAAGRNPSFDPVHGVDVAVNRVLHGDPNLTPAERAAMKARNRATVGGPVFSPLGFAIDAVRQLPNLVPRARDTAVKIAHPSKENPPSLGQNLEGLLSGSFGVPRMGYVSKKPSAPPRVTEPPIPSGHVRLYRGEGSTSPVSQEARDFYGQGNDVGGWFTDTRAVAEEYARRNKGPVYYLDAPADVVRPWSRLRESDNGQKWTEYRLPNDKYASLIAQKKPLGAVVPTGSYASRANPPRVAKGKATPETAGDLGQQVREGLRGAKAARVEQDKLYSAERSKRAGAANQAMTDIGGREGYQAALGELKGELPKLKFGGFENFDQAGLDALFTHIQQHPTLRPFQKINAQTALSNVINGKVPTPSDLRLMEQVFGREVRTQIAASIPTWAKAKRLGIELLNVPRSLMASFDLSAPFRQGLVAGVSHPVMFAKNFGPMTKALVSEKAYAGIMDEIASRPTFQRMQDAGLALTDMGRLETREEQFMSNLAERIPVLGRGVRGSGRAYTGFLNKMRADLFDSLLRDAEKQGLNLADRKLVDSIARFVNSATGRGDLGAFQSHAVTLNTLLFSPRLLFSRLNFLNPVYYAKLDPFARKEALKAALSLVGTISTVLYIAKLGGADVNIDPRSADFAKMKLGNTRIDVLGGFQQPVRLLSQLASGKVISSTTGKTLTLGPQGPGKLSRWDIGERFVLSKFGPVPSFVHDTATGTDFAGQPLKWDFSATNPAFQRMLPLLGQDAYQLYQQEGALAAIGGYALGGIGLGIQSYGPKPASASSGNVFDTSPSSGGSSSGGNIFDK